MHLTFIETVLSCFVLHIYFFGEALKAFVTQKMSDFARNLGKTTQKAKVKTSDLDSLYLSQAFYSKVKDL